MSLHLDVILKVLHGRSELSLELGHLVAKLAVQTLALLVLLLLIFEPLEYAIEELPVSFRELLDHLPSVYVILGEASLGLSFPHKFVVNPHHQDVAHVPSLQIEELRLRRSLRGSQLRLLGWLTEATS